MWRGLGVVARATLLRLAYRRILIAAVVVAALPLAGVLLLGVKGGSSAWKDLLAVWLDAALPLAGLLLGSQAVAAEVDEGTALVVWTSGQPRWVLPAGSLAVLVPAGSLLAALVLSLAAWAGPASPSWTRLVLAGMGVAAVAVALAGMAGAFFPKHGIVAALAAGGVVNLLFTKLPGKARLLAPGFHARRIAGLPTHTVWDRFWPPPRPTTAESVLALAVMVLVFTALACWWVQVHEYKGRSP